MSPLKPGLSFLSYDWYDAKEKFLELTGWESDDSGLWNCKFNKEVTFVYWYDENHFFQHEQDYIYIDPYPEDTISLEDWHAMEPKNIATDYLYEFMAATWKYDGFISEGHTVLQLPLGVMLKYLRDRGELPKDTPIILATGSWAS